MIIYKHHIGDFNNSTRHLTRLERSIYRDLIELYYDTESPIPLDIQVVCRKVMARDQQEVTAVEQVLNEFFTKTNGGWFHTRCEEEIDAYQSNTTAKAAAGKASAEAKARRKAEKLARLQQTGNGCSTDVHQVLNSVETEAQQNPTNYNLNLNLNLKKTNTAQAPVAAKAASVTANTLSRDYGVPEQAAHDYLAIRKAKRLPLTQTAWERLQGEFALAGMSPRQGVVFAPPRAGRALKRLGSSVWPRMGEPMPRS